MPDLTRIFTKDPLLDLDLLAQSRLRWHLDHLEACLDATARAPHDTSLDTLFDQIPSIAGLSRTVTELPGGLTNRNFKITTPNGTFVARVASGGSELLAIDRNHEHANSLRAAAAGVGAPVIEYVPDIGVLVLGFIEGRTLTNADVAESARLGRIA